MKKLLVVLVAMCGMALADTVVMPSGVSLVPIPAGFTATTSVIGGNTPYCNNPSMDGLNFNIGDFLTNQGNFAGGTLAPTAAAFLGVTAVAGNGAAGAPLSFSMLRTQTSINVTILYANSSVNNLSAFGIYDVNNCTLALCPKTQIYGVGTIPNNSTISGVPAGVNQSTAGISGVGNYGFYATACQSPGSTNCFTFFSDTNLNPSVTNASSSFIVEGPNSNPLTAHEHFALFSLNGNASTFYLGFENSVGASTFDGTAGAEHYGDFNDIIFQITTASVPEPATLSMMGLGLLGLGLMGRRRLQK